MIFPRFIFLNHQTVNSTKGHSLSFSTQAKKIPHPLEFLSHSGALLAQPGGYLGAPWSHFWGVFSTNIPLCDGLSGVRRSKGYNPLLRVSADGKVRKISPCFSQ